MIKVIYEKHSITMSGHAGSAPIGEDLICAAASTLITALAETMAKHQDKLSGYSVKLESGDAHVKVTPTEEFKETCDGAFEMALSGFELLSSLYPAYILLRSCI